MIVPVILGIWAVISIIAHIPSFPAAKFSFLYDLALIPQWNFFAPNPPKGDFIILFRDKMIGNELSNWVEIRRTGSRGYFCWIWNPDKRANKGQFDLITELMIISNNVRNSDLNEEQRSETIIQTLPYLTLLQYVIGYQKSHLSIARQFAILTKTNQGFEVVFTSNFHEVI